MDEHVGCIAQWLELSAANRIVAGSTPATPFAFFLLYPMDIKDVAFLAILDPSKNILLSYTHDSFNPDVFLPSIDDDISHVSLFKEQTVLFSRMNAINIVLVSFPESNELFISNAFEALVSSLGKILKNWTVARISEKYDQIFLILHEFVFKGIVMTDEEDELSSRVMKRTFESMSAIKVNKGFASFLNKATKSFRK